MWPYLLLVPVGFLFCSVVLPSFWGGAWSPTPARIIRQMAELAEFEEGDTLFDLGAGDGRVILRLTKDYPISAVGVEIDPLKCLLLRGRVRMKRLGGRVRVIRRDFFQVDLSEANVVFLYLSPAAHNRLRDKLARELPDGARVVCYRRPMPGWNGRATSARRGLYLYRMRELRAAEEGATAGVPCDT